MNEKQEEAIGGTSSDAFSVIPVEESVDHIHALQNKAIRSGELIDIVDLVKYLVRVRIDTEADKSTNFYHNTFEEAEAWIIFAESSLGYKFPEILQYPNQREITSDAVKFLQPMGGEKAVHARASELMRAFSDGKEKTLGTRENDPWPATTAQKA